MELTKLLAIGLWFWGGYILLTGLRLYAQQQQQQQQRQQRESPRIKARSPRSARAGSHRILPRSPSQHRSPRQASPASGASSAAPKQNPDNAVVKATQLVLNDQLQAVWRTASAVVAGIAGGTHDWMRCSVELRVLLAQLKAVESQADYYFTLVDQALQLPSGPLSPVASPVQPAARPVSNLQDQRLQHILQQHQHNQHILQQPSPSGQATPTYSPYSSFQPDWRQQPASASSRPLRRAATSRSRLGKMTKGEEVLFWDSDADDEPRPETPDRTTISGGYAGFKVARDLRKRDFKLEEVEPDPPGW